MRAASQKWGYIRIITGTILGGILGFYVMHRVETNYKEKMNERLRNYEAELKRKKEERLEEFEESSKSLSNWDVLIKSKGSAWWRTLWKFDELVLSHMNWLDTSMYIKVALAKGPDVGQMFDADKTLKRTVFRGYSKYQFRRRREVVSSMGAVVEKDRQDMWCWRGVKFSSYTVKEVCKLLNQKPLDHLDLELSNAWSKGGMQDVCIHFEASTKSNLYSCQSMEKRNVSRG